MTLENDNSLKSLTGAKQTMLAWSKKIDSFEELPEIYKDFFNDYLASHSSFPYIVLVPPMDKPMVRKTEKLIIDRGAAIQVIERSGSELISKIFSYTSVRFLETGNILLYSWLLIKGVTTDGKENSSMIEFNPATGDSLLAPFLEKMRPAAREAEIVDFETEKAKFDYLSSSNFKLMNYGRNSLLRGETVRNVILQPEILKSAWQVLGWSFFPKMNTVHLTILTDQELILICEDERSPKVKGSRYGGTWQYIPLQGVSSASLSGPVNGLFTLSFNFPGGETIQRQYAADCRPELEQLCSRINQHNAERKSQVPGRW